MYGEKIKRIREERGMTLHELGRQLKVRHSTVGAWENSTFPPLKAIHKICDYFNIQLWEFFIEDENELNQYLPAYITDEDVKIIKTLNLKIDGEQRKEIKLIFEKILFVVLQSYPTKQ